MLLSRTKQHNVTQSYDTMKYNNPYQFPVYDTPCSQMLLFCNFALGTYQLFYYKVPQCVLREVTIFRLCGPTPLIGVEYQWMCPFLLPFLCFFFKFLSLLLHYSLFLTHPFNLLTTTLSWSGFTLDTHASYEQVCGLPLGTKPVSQLF